MPDSSVKVRIAPSPTGYLHVGTGRMAIANYLFARKTEKGTFTPIYAGETGDISERFDNHHKMPCIIYITEFARVRAYRCKSFREDIGDLILGSNNGLPAFIYVTPLVTYKESLLPTSS